MTSASHPNVLFATSESHHLDEDRRAGQCTYMLCRGFSHPKPRYLTTAYRLLRGMAESRHTDTFPILLLAMENPLHRIEADRHDNPAIYRRFKTQSLIAMVAPIAHLAAANGRKQNARPSILRSNKNLSQRIETKADIFSCRSPLNPVARIKCTANTTPHRR